MATLRMQGDPVTNYTSVEGFSMATDQDGFVDVPEELVAKMNELGLRVVIEPLAIVQPAKFVESLPVEDPKPQLDVVEPVRRPRRRRTK